MAYFIVFVLGERQKNIKLLNIFLLEKQETLFRDFIFFLRLESHVLSPRVEIVLFNKSFQQFKFLFF